MAKSKRTVIEDLHPDALIEGHIYEVCYLPNLNIKTYTEVETVVFKGMMLPTPKKDYLDHTLLVMFKLIRTPSHKSGLKIFKIHWSQVVSVTYLNKVE